MTTLTGKGMWIWNINKCEGGNAVKIAAKAKAAGFSHVFPKVADGPYTFNTSSIAALVAAMHAQGIQVWGWQYVYGYFLEAEPIRAIERVKTLGLDGFIINAEKEYVRTGMETKVKYYCDRVKAGVGVPIAFSSYRFPSNHKPFPFALWLSYCDYAMPQVYWVGAHNPVAQLEQSVKEYKSIAPNVPIIPTGAVYSTTNPVWSPTVADVADFLGATFRMGLNGVNFWSWEHATVNLWNLVSGYQWEPPTPTWENSKDAILKRLAIDHDLWRE